MGGGHTETTMCKCERALRMATHVRARERKLKGVVVRGERCWFGTSESNVTCFDENTYATQ